MLQCYSQKQGNIWYFGGDYNNPGLGGAGLDFNSGTPIPLYNSTMPFTSGCASYCNSKGELLFYCNGETVYDRTHHVMQNGDSLGGKPTNQQSVLIVPFSKDTNMYYIFTNDGYYTKYTAFTGLHYSIINMSLNNGLGSVINPKAISLLKINNAQLTGCNHSNGKDFWVITATKDSFKLYAYQVNDIEIKSPVISNLGLGNDAPFMSIEISPKGNKIALKAVNVNQYFRYIIDFDANTGQFSNPYPVGAEHEINGVWNTGCSFSPSADLFYDIEYIPNNGDNLLYQYDLNAPDINLSKLFIASIDHFLISDMQIGPDGKIYFGGGDDNSIYLDFIEKPNFRGINCGYHKSGIYLGGKKPGAILPNELLYIKKPTSTKSVSKNKPLEMGFNHDSKQLIFHSSDNKKYDIQIFNIQGQSVLTKEVSDNSPVNVASLPIGLYFYSIESEKKLLQTGKILIY